MNVQKNLREILLDTETTGLSHEKGDRIVDIACIELMNHVPTGRTYQTYVNPEDRLMNSEATAISGITDDFLVDKPLFRDIVDDFLEFVGDATLVIHNAKFDVGFLNSELNRLNKPLFRLEKAVDTLAIARKKFPGAPANLDALCKRFSIDTSCRTKHGALVDCFLLADVYINLLGGRQGGLSFVAAEKNLLQNKKLLDATKKRSKRSFLASDEEVEAHKEFATKNIDSPMWNNKYEKAEQKKNVA
jgi:DNA polymerase-3 subunit epsilon